MTDIAWTSPSISLCPDWCIKKSHRITMGMFSYDFLYQSLTLHSLLFFHIPISPMQSLLSLPKTGRKMGLQIYGMCLEAKTSEIPKRKSDILTLALLFNQSEKSEHLLGENSGFILWTGVSKLWENTAAKRDPHRSQGVQGRREKKHE